MYFIASSGYYSLIHTNVNPYNASAQLDCTLIACKNQCLASSYRCNFSKLQARLNIDGKCFSSILSA